MLKLRCFILLNYLIINSVSFELKFEGCDNDGWTCSNSTDNKIDVTFNCPKDFQKNNPEILWEFQGLPAEAKSLTIQNCDASLSLNIKTRDVAVRRYPHLNNLSIKNVKKFILNETTFSLPELLNGKGFISFEDIAIDSFNSNSIGGSTLDANILKNFVFEMKNVKINQLKDRAVWWSEGEIPFKMYWNNVLVDVIEVNGVHITDTKKNPNTQVKIENSKFGVLKKKSFSIHSTDFQFINNEVKVVERSAFKITSGTTIISKNIFSNVNDFAFLFVNIGSGENNLKFEDNTIYQAGKLAMNFGAPDYNEFEGKVSFRNNKFNCFNSTWLQRKDAEKINTKDGEEEQVLYVKYLKKLEKYILDNNENICISLPCSISISKFKDLYEKNTSEKNYCNRN